MTEVRKSLVCGLPREGEVHHRWEACTRCGIKVSLSTDSTTLIDDGRAEASCIPCAVIRATPLELTQAGGFMPDGTIAPIGKAVDAWAKHLEGVTMLDEKA